MSVIRRIVVAVLLLVAGVAGAAAWAWSAGVPVAAPPDRTDRVPSSPVVSTTTGSITARPAPPASTVAPRTSTTAAPDRWPGPLPEAWRRRLWLTLPATETSPVRSAPVIPVGPLHPPEKEWNPAFGTVEVYQDDRLALPCEGGAVFALGHANFSSVDQAWDIFYDVVDSERYEGDSGLEVGQQIVISLEDGTQVCRYEVVDLAAGPGQHLAASPGRYFLKTALSGEPGDPTGGPDDQLIRRAWESGEPTLYLFGSYAGPSGEEMDDSGVHQAYNFVVAARLVDPG